VALLVAVALHTVPSSSRGKKKLHSKLAFPLASVVMVGSSATKPTPSPWPEGSGATAKHWTVKLWVEVLFSVPEIFVGLKGKEVFWMTEVIRGKFWRLFAPVISVGPGEAEVHMDAELTYGVAFAEGGPPGTAGVEAVDELMRLATAVHEIVLQVGASPRFSQVPNPHS
jgi:hypothetical protein